MGGAIHDRQDTVMVGRNRTAPSRLGEVLRKGLDTVDYRERGQAWLRWR